MTPQSPLDRDGAPRPTSTSTRASNAARPLLLGLAVASAFWLLAPRAEAACAPDTPPLADGGSVTCTGTDETGFDASTNTNVTITTSGVTVLDDSGAEDAAIVVGTDNTIVLGSDATLSVTDGVGILGGDDNDVDLGGTIAVTADGGVGVRMGSNTDPSSPSAIEIQNTGDLTVTGVNGVGIDVVDNYDVTNEIGGTITIGASASGGVALRGVDDNILWNSGTIVLDADDARAIQLRNNTGLPLPNGAITDGTVSVNGANGIVIEVGDDVGTLLDGTVDLNGTNGRGLSIGDRTDPAAQANHTNNGTTNVAGDGSIGIQAGDGWNSGSGASIQSDVRNAGTINVSGANATGIRVGDDANTSGNNNSFVSNFSGATIDVTGTDSVGVSLGGNDVLTPSDAGLEDVASFLNAGTITGDEDAGPLVEFRNAFDAFENRILNLSTGVLAADGTNAGTANRGIAIQGTDGIERVTNFGAITGDLFLAGGNDFFEHRTSGSFLGTVEFGAGDDTARLIAEDMLLNAFDVEAFADVETIEIDGLASTDPGFDLTGTDGFTGLLNVLENGALATAGGLTIGGNLRNAGRVNADLTFSGANAILENEDLVDGTVTFTTDGGGILNRGSITGDITFANGDNIYAHGPTASLGGTVFGGTTGTNTAQLADSEGIIRVFDLDALDGFEFLQVFGDDDLQPGWDLRNTAGFDGNIDVRAGASLDHAAPLQLGGDLTNSGRIRGDLVTGSIDTTITNTGVIDGAVTFGIGNDILAHSGEITGPVDLGDGDDEVRFGRDAILGARADGGLGDDVFELGDTGNSEREFDLATLSGFETIRVTGADPANTGWELLNGLAFSGLLDIEAGGALDADATTPVALDRTGDVRNAGRIGTELAFGSAGHTLTNLAGGSVEGVVTFGSGADTLDNDGAILADVILGGGDDVYRQGVLGSVDFGATIDGGSGTNDTAVLAFDDTTAGTFDLGRITGFERVQLEGGAPVMGMNASAGWRLTNGAGYGGGVEVLAGARLAATSPVNPVSLGGDLTFSDGSAVDLRVDGLTTPLVVAGTVSLDGEAAIDVDPGLGVGTYTVIDAGTRVGSFDTISLPGASGLISFSTLETATGLDLILASATSFGDPSIAFGANNQAIGSYLTAINGDAGTSPALQSALNGLARTDGSVDNVLSAISPESYDAQSAVVMEGGRRVARILMERPRDCTKGEMEPWQGSPRPIDCHARRWAPWVSGVGSYRSRDGFAGHPEYDALLGGIVVGLDAPSVAGFDFTFAVSSQYGKVDFERFGDADLAMTEVSGHVAWNHGPLRAQGVASWAHTRHESKRAIAFSEGTGATAVVEALSAQEDFDSSRFLVAAEVGARFDVGPVQIEPIAAFDWIRMEVDGLTESGAGVYDARIASRDDDVFTTRTGVRLGAVYEYRRYLHRYLEWATGVWRPSLDLRWRQTISGNERDVRASLVQAPNSVAPFSVQAKEDAGGFELGAGLTFAPKHANRLEIQIGYDLYRASHTLDHDLTARIRIGF